MRPSGLQLCQRWDRKASAVGSRRRPSPFPRPCPEQHSPSAAAEDSPGVGVVRARHRRGGSGRTTKHFGARWLGARPAAGARRGHLGCSQGSASSSISAKGPKHGLGNPAPPPRTVRGAGARSRLPRRPYGLRHGRHAVAGPRPSPGLHRPARILPSPARVLNMAAAPSACSHGSPAHQAPLPAKRPAPHPRPARVGAGRTSRRVRRARACSPPAPRAAPSPCRPLPRDQTPAHSRRCLRAASLPLPTAPRPPRGSRCTSEC